MKRGILKTRKYYVIDMLRRGVPGGFGNVLEQELFARSLMAKVSSRDFLKSSAADEAAGAGDGFMGALRR